MILLVTLLTASPASAVTTRDAIVVTFNGAADLDRPDLRYADDDGLQYATLFRQAFGADHVTLLTQFDSDTQQLRGASADAPPTHDALFTVITRHAERVAERKKHGEDTELYLIFAGHGDVRDGQGFLQLADGPLTASELDTRVLTPLDAARVHLVIDSCNSYFMVTPRKAGGRAFHTPAPSALQERHKNVSVLLSTSAEAVTYEWSEVQSGIFSYLVRSGLRGAADADGDGHVSYAELRAFIGAATATIENEAYRPRVYARSAANTAIFFDLPAHPDNALLIEPGAPHRLTLRDDHGVRLADLHCDGSKAVRLWLPREKLSVEELSGKRLVRKEIGPSEQRTLASLAEADDTVAARGESPVFKHLFANPFGARAVEEAATQPAEDEAYGVSRADIERYRAVLGALAAQARAHRYDRAWMFGTLSAGFLAAGIPTTIFGQHDGSAGLFGISLIVAGGGLAAISLPIVLARKSGTERLFEEFSHFELKTETARSLAAAHVAQFILARADADRRSAIASGVVGIVLAAGFGALSGLEFSTVPQRSIPTNTLDTRISYGSVVGGVSAGLAAALLIQAIRVLATLPPRFDRIEQVLDAGATESAKIIFDGVSVGTDGKRTTAQAGFRF